MFVQNSLSYINLISIIIIIIIIKILRNLICTYCKIKIASQTSCVIDNYNIEVYINNVWKFYKVLWKDNILANTILKQCKGLELDNDVLTFSLYSINSPTFIEFRETIKKCKDPFDYIRCDGSN